jgi:multidrug efflux pump subunit AcrA (membrane-fusion protein)
MNYKSKKFPVKSILITLAVISGAGLAVKYFWPSAAPETKTPIQTVTTFKVEQRDFPLVIDSTGTTVASSIVDIRPQVTNVVAKVHIKEGQKVRAGDVLFTLDDRADKANYEKAKASADDAQRQYERAQELLRQQFVAQGAVDTAQANAQSAQAVARAALATLSYDTIRSPITDRAGIINVFPGALVQPGNTVSTTTTATTTTAQGAMVTITQLDPINVQFTVPEGALPSLFAAQQAGQTPTISFQMGNGAKREGKVYVVDNQVDAAIGAVKVKAEVNNADHSLIPGQFIRLQLKAGLIKDALVVPSQAVISNSRGDQIFVVDEENTVSLKPIKIQTQGQGFAVISGINAGDKVVVEGKQNLRPNSKVREAGPKPDAKPEGKNEGKPSDAKPEAKAETKTDLKEAPKSDSKPEAKPAQAK